MRIIEVGPRDGLQNEKTPVSSELKIQFMRDLVASGLTEIEVTSFVSPKWVPQLADAAEVLQGIGDVPSAHFSALIPNLRGLERALELRVPRIAVFTAASDAFTQKNLNMTVEESLTGFAAVIDEFRKSNPNGWVRGYVSTAFECPFAGRIEPKRVAEVAEKLFALGCNEISLGDTIGVAVPAEVRRLDQELRSFKQEQIAWHFHDTRGTAIANVFAALDLGYTAFDSSAAGLGGCPYAPGAGGNLATDDLVYALERSGIATGVDPLKLMKASLPILEQLGRPVTSKAQQALLSHCQP